ncbi:helix-turn-helix domain-containing protein [Paenibacillus sp. GbtcB18]|uniref:helix-turn-helix domain-containing protein n=1 Tax=Paenibacillus sp. GbtcB18 TaxID=2824763 RepID=UPI001C30E787|nr:helix-turn-helix transcriptional regulator [Paenibacillus sp. GbtcB18]
MQIRPRLSEILAERGMTQTACAELAGIPQAAISRFDKSTQHKDEHVFRIAHALNISVEQLFVVEDDK